ncbi:MAG: 1,2-phenylacetyl-CoA epoxidase subunit B [Candidatus Kapabacteria bacterium]|nr:1,2-phenylacetyl-CoA epoxidase subunit B [Candidatus Kapabacteria bacterium]MDW8012067.1 1,2-phenylacetyl-CoA epoxidase subunit B [Bacteroidota bacterium]
MSAPHTVTIQSLDPRINRLRIPAELPEFTPKPELDEWEPYEVFWKEKPGDQPVHVGTVHAPNPEMALVLAKEGYCRRGETYTIWVVRTADIYTFGPDDADIFATVPEKTYREPDAYKVVQKILRLKRQQQRERSSEEEG